MSDQEEVTAKLYVYNEIIETQLYMIDRLLEFNERGGATFTMTFNRI